MAEVKTYLNYINGEWKAASTNEVEASINPAYRHEYVGYVQKSSKEDLDETVAKAKKAQQSWRKIGGLENPTIAFCERSLEQRSLDERSKKD